MTRKVDWTATHITLYRDSDLSAMPPSLPACETLYASGCTGLTSLPELPACKTLNATGCTLRTVPDPVVVPDLHRRVYEACSKPHALDMGEWHACDTTHCRAGWAITLAGDAGKALEKKYSPAVAGVIIYAATYPDEPIPDFYATNADAMADIRRCAGVAEEDAR